MTRRRLRRTWPQRLLLTFGVFTTLSLLMAAGGLAYGLSRYKSITFVSVPEVQPAPPGEPVNWLLVGFDSRDGIDANDPNAGAFLGEKVTGKRTDTMILARVNPKDRTVDLLSIPRDLWVPIAGTNERGRINSAFNGDGGEDRLVSTVEKTLGIQVNNYAEINFVGFQSIIDSVGGVPIYFQTPVRDTHSGLDIKAAGCQTLNGSDSLAFVRSRYLEYFDKGTWHDDGTGDLGRTARQQYLMARLADIASSKLDMTNLVTIDHLLSVGGRNLTLDDSASPTKLFSLARTFAGVGSEGIHRHALPVTPRVTAGGADVLDLNTSEAQPTLDIFRGKTPVDATVPPSTETVPRNSFTVDVSNGAKIARLGSKSAADLKTAGFKVGTVGDAQTGVDHTVIRYPSTLAAGASVLGTSLSTGPTYQLDNTLTNVQLVLGPDYKGVGPASATTAPAAPAMPAEGENIVGVIPIPGPPGTACAP